MPVEDDIPPILDPELSGLLFPPPPVPETRTTVSLDIERVNMLESFSFFPTHEEARSPYVPPPFLPVSILPLDM
jgi:hypothetical protein